MSPVYRRRRRIERLMFGATAVATAVTLGVLVFLLGYIAWQGASALSLGFFTNLPAPVGEPGGGMANAIVGSGKLLLAAAAVGVPVGFLGGVYLAEYGHGRVASTVRYAADVLNGIPSIVIGITAYALLEKRFGVGTRRFASIVFMVTRAFADSVRVFATAIPIALILGPSVPPQYVMPVAILVLGALTLIYTYHGGMRAVVWTDVLQTSVYLLGGFSALYLIGKGVSGGWSAILEQFAEALAA